MSVTPNPLSADDTSPIRYWGLLMLLVLCGGSSFSGIRYAVETAPPEIVSAGRLWVAAIFLTLYMYATGRKMVPLLTDEKHLSPVWAYAIAIGAIGYTIPMFLFPFAQQTVSSMLAGIYMAFMPLATIFLAAMFASEPLTPRKISGFVAGAIGVIVLIGPHALSNILGANFIAQLALIGASTCYAVSSVITRRAPQAPARSFAVAFMLSAAVLATPGALLKMNLIADVSLTSWIAILYLGIVPTGVAAILIIQLIRGAGAGFMAMGNYITPVVAIAFGVILFREVLHVRYLFGLLIIMVGLSIAQPGPLRLLRRKVSEAILGRCV